MAKNYNNDKDGGILRSVSTENTYVDKLNDLKKRPKWDCHQTLVFLIVWSILKRLLEYVKNGEYLILICGGKVG